MGFFDFLKSSPKPDDTRLSTVLHANVERIRNETGHSPDVVVRLFDCPDRKLKAAAVYVDGLADKHMVGDFVQWSFRTDGVGSSKAWFQTVRERALSVVDIKTVSEWNELMLALLAGETVLLIDGVPEAICGNTRGGKTRNVEEPTNQVATRGPKDSFTETLGINVSLVRRRIKNPNLWMEVMKIGRTTKTDVAMMYVRGRADDNLVREVKSRLDAVRADIVLESAYIEEWIQDRTTTPFPMIYNTERPDIVAGNLLEGRVAILVDGTPFALIVPTVLPQFFQSVEDYYQRYDVASLIRLLRYASFVISMLVPSFYIALVSYHHEMIPTTLLLKLAAAREGVPFPVFVEALIMEICFEILREAGLRMPRAIGQAVSIVGPIVLGQAAVQAGIVSPAMMITVAITGIASFSTPAYNLALTARVLRFGLMVLATSFGFYGLAMGCIFLVAHVCSLRSFGVPYLSPIAPFRRSEQKDSVFRWPFPLFGKAGGSRRGGE
ncbi:MAG: spore germination protein [Candidatus Reconcilbacillus cellulovorans]|uniref:Spore germination protein n=1 Tax=Candidatus Reconcilbacillus cellulovorans TaxID=1906605 RepID=A0A2A6E496_9BACL|nr:MAG: spore germination protein [Candidatus Reconcilbacillus cellulovorans]